MAVDFPTQLRELRTKLESILEVSDLPRLEKQIAELSDQAAAPDLWDDPERAQTGHEPALARCRPRSSG